MYSIVQIGVGGNGGYLTQRLSKMLYAFARSIPGFKCSYSLVDGDRFEDKNLLRQPCIEEDIGFNKARVLAERYGNTYDLDILYRDSYIEGVKDIDDTFGSYHSNNRVLVLIGCVDNNATRKLMHEYFMSTQSNIVYIDSGIEAILDSDPASGYSGHVVCGVKIDGRVIMEPTGSLFPDILEDDESKLPTESCGDAAVSLPQRMMTNEMAALTAAGYLNTILGSGEIHSHLTNFNARLMVSKPEYIFE